MKNIIVLMYNFPPIGAGRGIAWTYFCNELSKKYKLTVFTISPSEYDPFYNADKYKLISENYQVIRTNAGPVYQRNVENWKRKASTSKSKKNEQPSSNSKQIISKLINKARKNLIFPDSTKFWNKFLGEAVLQFGQTQKVDLIISVGQPFSTHILATKVRKKLGSKLILDYGDPWSFNPSAETIPSERRWLDRLVEKQVLKQSNYVTVTTQSTRNAFEDNFPFVRDNIEVVTQGVDSSQFFDGKNVVHDKDEITLFYAGTFYKDIRNPKPLFEALYGLTDILQGKKVKIIIAGKMEDYVLKMAEPFTENQNADIQVEMLGNISFDEVANYQKKADALLFFGNYGGVQVPGKLFEYLATDRPIFAIIPSGDESERLLNSYSRGITVDYDTEQIKKEFVNFLTSVENGTYDQLEPVLDYDWTVLSNQYLNIVKKVLGDAEEGKA